MEDYQVFNDKLIKLIDLIKRLERDGRQNGRRKVKNMDLISDPSHQTDLDLANQPMRRHAGRRRNNNIFPKNTKNFQNNIKDQTRES